MADQITLDLNVSLSTDNAKREFTNMLNSMSTNTEAANRKINAALGGKEQKVVDIQYNPDTRQWESKERLMLSLVDKLNRTKSKADQIDRNSLTSLKGQVREATQVRDAISRTVINTNAYGKAVRSANPAWQDANNKVTALNRKIADASGNWTKMITARIPGGQNIMNLANGLTQVGFAAQAAFQALQMINQAVQPLINRTRQVQGLDMAFQGFGLSAQQSAQFMQNAKAQALTYGTSLTKLENGYKRIAPAVMAAGGSMNDVSMAMASIAARTTTLGLNTAQSGRYMEAFAQVMGKGKLQGEELTQQFSELDGSLRSSLASYFAANNGINNLEKAMQKGEITSGMFLQAFVAISQEMRTNLAGGLDNIQQRLDSMNIAQVEQLKQTLNTISLDALNSAFAGVGRQFQQMGVFISQLTATILNDMPRTLQALGSTLELLGLTLQGLVVLAGFITRVFFAALEQFIKQFYDAADAIKNFITSVPGGEALLNGLAKGAQDLVQGLKWMTDGWTNVAGAAGISTQQLGTLDGRVVMLSNRLRNGKIDIIQYRAELDRIGKEVQLQNLASQLETLNLKVVQLKKDIQAATQKSNNAKSVFEDEKSKLDVLKTAVKGLL